MVALISGFALLFFITGDEDQKFMGAAIYGIVLVLLLYRSFDNYLLISAKGFKEVSPFKTVEYEWDAIADCEVVNDEGTKILGFKTKGSHKNFLVKVFMRGNDFYLINSYNVPFETIRDQMKAKIKSSSI